MSDVNNTPDENEEEVSEEEASAAESVNLRDLGVEPLTTPIPDLLKLYRENHSVVNEYTKRIKSQKADPSDPVTIIKSNVEKAIKSDELKDKVASLRDFSEALTGKFFEPTLSLISATVLLSEAENLVSLLKDEMKYHFDTAVQAEKDAKGIKTTPAESAVQARLICVKLRSLIENRVNIAKMMDPDSLPGNLFKAEEAGKRGGFNTDVFPKTPRLDMGDAAPSSPASSAHLSFRFVPADKILPDGTFSLEDAISVPDGTTLRQVAHDFVSVGAYRVTGQTIEGMLKKAGYGIGATDTEWSLSFKTGTLYGRKVSG